MNSDYLLYVLVLSVFNTAFSSILPNMGYFDELLVLAILICTLVRRDFVLSREVKVCIGFFVFYVIYSLIMAVNVKEATIRDFVICTKPFVCFYTAQYYGLLFSEKAIHRCRKLIRMLGIYLWLIAPFIHTLYANTTFYYPACAYTGMVYILLSNRTKKDWMIATLFLTPGLLSIRAKFFAEFVIWIYLIFFLKKRIKFNISFLIIGCILFYVIYIINYEKIMFYMVNGLDDGVARTYMYYTSLEIFKDYFPLGSGFGTFATDSAAKYYSPLNYSYGLDKIWGLNPDDDTTGTSFYSDTFYPVLAQFGILGAYLFFVFVKRRWLEGRCLADYQLYKLFVFVFAYIVIQCVAENTFTGANGIPILLILGFTVSRRERKRINLNN